MLWTWDSLFTPPPISGLTINMVAMSPAFRNLLYLVIGLSLAASLVLFLMRHPFASALKRSVAITFFIAGLLYSFHADYGWSVWVSQDRDQFGGLTTEEKLLKLEGRWYEFIRRAGEVIPDEYMIYSSNQYLSQRGEYFLLPKRKRAQANTLIILNDSQVTFDQKKRVLVRGTMRYENVEPLLMYHPAAFVVRKQ